MVTSAVIEFVSKELINQLIIGEGLVFFKRWNKDTYSKQLAKVINETIKAYEENLSNSIIEGKYAFYHSQIIFLHLSRFILFKTKFSQEDIEIELRNNANIIKPTKKDLEDFFDLFYININKNEKLKKLFIQENYKEQIYILAEDMKMTGKQVDLIAEQLVFTPTKEYFDKQCNNAIRDLGNRYSPELNVETEIAQLFEVIGRTEVFKNLMIKSIDNILVQANKVNIRESNLKDEQDILENSIKKLYEFCDNSIFTGIGVIDFMKLYEIIIKLEEMIERTIEFYVSEESKLQNEKKNYHYYYKYGYEISALRELESYIDVMSKLLDSKSINLANNPFLLLYGEAGVGKSHLLADVVNKRMLNNHECLFILGQHLTTDEDPWWQILKRLRYSINETQLLTKINEYARRKGHRFIIFIDAINEGNGKKIWKNNINSFVSTIREFEWIGLVLSVRTSYKDVLIPKSPNVELKLIEREHNGFRNQTIEATKFFFRYYNINMPEVPLLNPEFQNPLFLKIFCEGLSKTGYQNIPIGHNGFSAIIELFMYSVNTILSDPTKCNYSPEINLVKDSVNKLIQYKIDYKVEYIPYKEACSLINEVVSIYYEKKDFIVHLIDEGILTKNIYKTEKKEDEEGIYLAYERFEDYLKAKLLLEQCDINEILKGDSVLHQYISDNYAIYYNRGLIESLSILIPEKYSIELIDLLPEYRTNQNLIMAFIYSLVWRKKETISNKLDSFIKENIIPYENYKDYFFETILQLSSVPNHYLNAEYIHSNLIELDLPILDCFWTTWLTYKYDDESSVKRIIDWAWNDDDKSFIRDDSILLVGTILSWFLSSTNRNLRDRATKALVCILKDRIHLLINLIKKFQKVNDPYVYERLFAVAYGCSVRTEDINELTVLSEYVYTKIFSEENEVIPHILLRDYARGVIEYAYYIKCPLSFDIESVRPPYVSHWPKDIKSLDNLKLEYKNTQYEWLLYHVLGFSDFARYTIGTNFNHSDWTCYRIGESLESKQELLLTFLKDLNDSQIQFFQNINLFEHVKAKNNYKNFKKSLKTEQLQYFERNIEKYLNQYYQINNNLPTFDLTLAQSIIMERVIELGWSTKLHKDYDESVKRISYNFEQRIERIGKKYQWIAYYEYMARLSDNFIMKEENKKSRIYQGPWEPYVRDIDPTILIKNTCDVIYAKNDNDFWWSIKSNIDWTVSDKNWTNTDKFFPDFEQIVNVKDENNSDWLILDSHHNIEEPKKFGEERWGNYRKTLECRIKSFIVKESDFHILKDYLITEEINDPIFLYESTYYNVYSREYYWSPAYISSVIEQNNGTEWDDVFDEDNQKIASVIKTASTFLWEEEFDFSKERNITFKKPARKIFTGMKLKYGTKEGELISENGAVVCFAACVYNRSESNLLIREKEFKQFLQQHDLRVIWVVNCEKRMIGGDTNDDYNYNQAFKDGVFYYKNDKLTYEDIISYKNQDILDDN